MTWCQLHRPHGPGRIVAAITRKIARSASARFMSVLLDGSISKKNVRFFASSTL